MIRILKPGGRIILWGPNWDNIFRKDFPQYAHQSIWYQDRKRWNIVLSMILNEFNHRRYKPAIDLDVAALAQPEKYLSFDTDAVHSVLCQETVHYFEGKKMHILYLGDLRDMLWFIRNGIAARCFRRAVKWCTPLIRKIPFFKWFVIRFPLVVEKQ